jgi:hypothetical protein
MSKTFRLALLLGLAVVALFADSRCTFAQRIVIGGQNNERDRDDDDEEDEGDDRDNRSSQSGDRNVQQLQQLLQRGQGGQRGQGQDGDIRRSNRPGQFPGQPFQDQQRQFHWTQEGGHNHLGLGTWQGGKWQGARDVEKWVQVFGGNQKPFSNEWYQQHPKAWKHDHRQSNVWVVATLPGVYSWLGWGQVPPQYNVGFGNAPQFDPSHFGDWYPLGVYSLMAGPGDMGTRIVQLAVDRHGHVAGNYYDMITDSNYSLSGDIRRQSQGVYWSLNKNKFVRFRAHISQLLRPYGSLTVQLPGGEQEWQFVRLED